MTALARVSQVRVEADKSLSRDYLPAGGRGGRLGGREVIMRLMNEAASLSCE